MSLGNHHRVTSRFTYLVAAAVTAWGCQDRDTAPTGPDAAAPAAATPDFAVASNSWITRHNMPTDRWWLATATVTNAAGHSIVYAIGGRNVPDDPSSDDGGTGTLGKVQAYDVATDTWTTKASLPLPLSATNGAGVINGKVYVSGGYSGYKDIQNGLFVYDPAANTWTQKHPMPLPTLKGVTGVINNRLYVLATPCDNGDCAFPGDSPVFYRYDPATDSWASLPPPNNQHQSGAGGTVDGKFYVVGGGGKGDYRKLDIYDPATNQWTTKAGLGRGRWFAAGVGMSGKLYIMGGTQLSSDGSSLAVVATTSVYVPATNSWSTKAPLPSPRAGIAASRVALNGQLRIEVVGGARPGNNVAYIP
jgi:N-acetylneuraminic acid mutarotase